MCVTVGPRKGGRATSLSPRPPPLVAEERQAVGDGSRPREHMHPRRLVSPPPSRRHTHARTHVYAHTSERRVVGEGSKGTLSFPSPVACAKPPRVQSRSAVACCLARSARHFLSSHPPPPCGALLFTLLVPVHGMWIRPSYPHTSFPSSQSICEQGSSFVPHVCTRMHLMDTSVPSPIGVRVRQCSCSCLCMSCG